jgi:hypothetical protein
MNHGECRLKEFEFWGAPGEIPSMLRAENELLGLAFRALGSPARIGVPGCPTGNLAGAA